MTTSKKTVSADEVPPDVKKAAEEAFAKKNQESQESATASAPGQPMEQFNVPVTPGTTIMIQHAGVPQSAPRKISAWQSFVSGLTGSIVMGIIYYLLYTNRNSSGFLGEITFLPWIFLFVFFIAVFTTAGSGVALLAQLASLAFKNIMLKPTVFLPLVIVIVIVVVVVLVMIWGSLFPNGNFILLQGKFYDAVVDGLEIIF